MHGCVHDKQPEIHCTLCWGRDTTCNPPVHSVGVGTLHACGTNPPVHSVEIRTLHACGTNPPVLSDVSDSVMV